MLAAMQLAGCASVVNGGNMQAITVVALDDSDPIDGADCVLENSGGRWSVKTPGMTKVNRTNVSLTINCNKEGYQPGTQVSSPRVSGALYGNLLVGGLIGVAVDMTTGAGFEYDRTVQVKMTKVKDSPVVPSPSAPTPSVTSNTSPPIPVRSVPSGDTPVRITLSDSGSSKSQSVAGNNQQPAELNRFETAKKTCEELAIKPQTEQFGQCVLRLSR